MARHRHREHWWPAGLWLPIVLAAAVDPAWAHSGADVDGSRGGIAGVLHRWVAPLGEAAGVAVGGEHNVMAANAAEMTEQVLATVGREQEMRELRRRKLAEQNEVVVEVRTALRPAAAPRAGNMVRAPVQTPEATLDRRQNNDGQIVALSAQIQSLSLVASSISQASRQVSQTSQQLSQSVQQLSQSTDRLSQSINQLQNSVQQAQQSAQQAQQAAQQASQSADDAVRSAQSSANAAIASNLASATSAAANMIAVASASAINIVNVASSQVQAAKADATVARADAASQVMRAQGTAVSVTQAALAIVGTFVGSSLLTIAAFYLILRYRSKQRRRTRLLAARGIGYPQQLRGGGDDFDDASATGDYGYPIDLKEPPRPRRSLGSQDGRDSDVGDFDEKRPQPAYLRDPLGAPRINGTSPGPGFGLGAFGSASGSSLSGPVSRKNSGDSDAQEGGRGPVGSRGNNGRSSFSLFPKTPTSGDERFDAMMANAPQSQRQMQQQPLASPSLYATGASAMTSRTLAQARATTNNANQPPPSLQQWLREGTVSPFGTLRRDSLVRSGSNGGSSSNNIGIATSIGGPFERKQQQLRTMMKRSMGVGVGGVNAGGGAARVMQPGGSLPLRNN